MKTCTRCKTEFNDTADDNRMLCTACHITGNSTIALWQGYCDFKARVAELQEEIEEYSLLQNKLSKLLTDTANALHGGPKENGLWSWHDLAQLVEQMKLENKLLTEKSIDLEKTVNGLKAEIENLQIQLAEV